MRGMRRFFSCGFVFVCGVATALLGPSSPAHAQPESADDCVAIVKTERADGLDFELDNNCERPLACTLGWTLSCENDKGKVTSSERHAASFAVAKESAKHAFGSAAVCKTSGWRIDDVGWTCAPAASK